MALVRGGISTGQIREIEGEMGAVGSTAMARRGSSAMESHEGSVMWWIVVVVWDLTMGKFFWKDEEVDQTQSSERREGAKAFEFLVLGSWFLVSLTFDFLTFGHFSFA
jgi:nitrate reductase NapE component